MDPQQAQIDYQEEDYHNAYSSPQTDSLSELLLTSSDQKLIEMITRWKNDTEKFSSITTELKQYLTKNKNSKSLKNLETKILHLMANLKSNDRYCQTQNQKNILWAFEKLCCNEKIMTFSEQIQKSFLNIFVNFTNFQDFSPLVKIARNFIYKKPVSIAFSERLNHLYYEKYEILTFQQNKMAFGQTMKNLCQQNQLIVKVQILNFFIVDSSKFKIPQTQIQSILSVLNVKPYQKLLEHAIQKRMKPVKHLRTTILKSKMELIDDKIELVFGSKCQLCKQLRTRQVFELAARKSDGSQLISELDPQTLILHGEYLFTKWSPQVLISAKQKVSYDALQEQINQGFMKILSFMKKIFEHKHKEIQVLENKNKIIQENNHNKTPKETVDYFCHILQLFVKFLSFNSLQINHRSQNLSELIPHTLFEQILKFFQENLRQRQQQKNQQKVEVVNQKKQLLIESVDYLITFAAHLFYRRDYQSLTAISSKPSQSLINIMLMLDNFPSRWNILRNYKLVIDRWGESVEEGSQQYKKIAKKFMDCYFSEKVTVYSKSNSTVFNPIFITRPYCKIFGSQFLRCVQNFEKMLDERQGKNQLIGFSAELNSAMSKIILFMSARIRFQEVNKIAEHLQRIYRKYAHIIPEIYLFRAWIMQVNFAKVSQSQISLKLTQSTSILKQFFEVLKKQSGKTLLTSLYKLNESQNCETLKLLNIYKSTLCKTLNSLELKTKNQEYGHAIYQAIWNITKEHLELSSFLKNQIQLFEKQNPLQYATLKEENDLLNQTDPRSLFWIVEQIKNDFLAVMRYYLCSSQKILSPKDHSALVKIIGQFLHEIVVTSDNDKNKFFSALKDLHILIGTKLPAEFKSHLMKKQILGAMRAANGADQLDLTRSDQLSLNQVSSLYEQIKPVYTKLIKLLLQPQNAAQKEDKQKYDIYQCCQQLLQSIILPTSNIVGSCYFNGKIEEKATEDMALGIFWQQVQNIISNFSIEQLVKLNSRYSLSSMFEITKKKQSKISQNKNIRNNLGDNIFTRAIRPQRGMNEAMDQLRQINIPQEFIQLAMENIQVPDPQVALQWIQNNQERMDTLLFQRTIRQSKEQVHMKSQPPIKSEIGKITPLKYPQFIDNLQKNLKNLVKSLFKEIFSENGKNIVKLLFIILDAFKEDYKRKQYQNFAKKMFEQINALNGKQKFDDKKYRLIQRILIYTMRKQTQLYNNYYKQGICLKTLSFVSSFGNSLVDKQQKNKQQKQDFEQLIQTINQTLPQWKLPVQDLKPEFINYTNLLLDVINLSDSGNKDVWQILYKIGLLQNGELNKKIITLFSKIIVSKQIFEEQMKKINQEAKQAADKKMIFTTKTLPSKSFMLPLAKLLIEQNSQILLTNAELEIKGFIAEYYKEEMTHQLQKENQKQVIQIDLKVFNLAFDKFVGSKQFEEVFKKLFTKKRNKKYSLFYDFSKHPLELSEFYQENNPQSFLSLKFDQNIEQILKTFITRPVIMLQKDRQLQEEALIDLYKLLDYFKVLIPTSLRIEWNHQNNKTNLLQWLFTQSVASNKKKFQFMTFLTMNNNLLVNKNRSISDYVCHEYLTIFKNQIAEFNKSKRSQKIEEESINHKNANENNERFKKILVNFIYLLQFDNFNKQCFLSLNFEPSILEQLQNILLSLEVAQSPLLYTLISQSLFILKKRQMIERLKQKYAFINKDQTKIGIQSSIYLDQFLNMSLIYKADPNSLHEGTSSNRKKRNIFNGSNGRIIVDQMDDEAQALQQMQMNDDQEADEYDSITNIMRMRFRNRDSRQRGNEYADDYELYPIEQLIEPQQQVNQNNVVNNEIPQQQINQNQGQNISEQNIADKQKNQQQQQKQEPKIQKIDYLKLIQQQSQQLLLYLQQIQKLLPQWKSLENQNSSLEQITIQQNLTIKLQQEQKNYTIKLNNFEACLSDLIKKMTLIALPKEAQFSANPLKPQFSSKITFTDGSKKLTKFQKRFKSIITTIIPQITTEIWQDQHTAPKGGFTSILRSELREGEVPSARWLLSRLQRQASQQNRQQMIQHIQRLINQRRGQQVNTQATRPRVLNLTTVINSLPQEPQAPKVQEKKEQKIQSKEQQVKPEEKQIKEEIKIENTHQIQEEKIQIPSQEKMEQEKQQAEISPVQKKEPVTDSLPKQTQQKIQQNPNNQMQPEDKLQQPLNINEQSMKQQDFLIPKQFSIPQIEQIIPELPQQIIQQQQPQQIIQEPQHVGPYRQILAMFGLSQSFLADNGIDPQSFDSLPEQFQIDQITHYMNQAQNRQAVNQLNQANQPAQHQQQAQQGQAAQGQQPGNSVNDVLQQNIALFASMDPQTRAQMLADYPPEFLLQLPVQMRTQVQQFRQRQLHRIAQMDDDNMVNDWRQQVDKVTGTKKQVKIKNTGKYPTLKELNFNPIQDSIAKKLAQCIFLKISKLKTLQGFRILLENHLTQSKAIATIVGLLRLQEGVRVTQVEFKSQQNGKGEWKIDQLTLNQPLQLTSIKQALLHLILETLNNQLYKDEEFLINKNPYDNYFDIKIQPHTELEADQQGFWPLFQLLPYSLNLCPKLSVQILKRVKVLPVKLIKNVVQAMRADKLTSQVYKNLQFLSKNQDMKAMFVQQFPEDRPLKHDIFAKILKYEFSRVSYLKKMHEQALNFYSAQYNQFLNQIFGIYTIQDIKQIQSLLIKHKHVHFQVIKYLYSKNRVLDKEPMGLILKMPHLLDFQTKKYIFRKHPKIRRASRYRLPIQVSRTNILQQSYNQIMSKTPKQLEGRLQVTFMDEQGYDAGGLTREWLLCLSREIFRPDYALFEPSSSGNTYQPNPKSYINPDHLKYFKFIGRFVGKALSENELVDAYFTRAVYKMILGQQIELSDLQQQDYSFYKSMLWLKDNQIEDGDYTFSYLYDNFGQRIVKDLIPGGRNMNVNEENKLQYIQKYCLAKMRDDFKTQMENFLEGFHQIVPHQCISFFEAKQLELLISGLPQISFEDLKNNVDYSGFTPTDNAIKWFWEILEQFTQQDLARLIQFITGTSKIPVDGFANIKGMNGPQRISIHKDPNGHQLPKAHTCFNQLDLPNYETKQVMRQRIVTAITWGSEGFGFM